MRSVVSMCVYYIAKYRLFAWCLLDQKLLEKHSWRFLLHVDIMNVMVDCWFTLDYSCFFARTCVPPRGSEGPGASQTAHAVLNTRNCSALQYRCTCSALKVHVQCMRTEYNVLCNSVVSATGYGTIQKQFCNGTAV